MTLDINFGPGYWRFKLVTADSVPVPVLPTTVAVTFQVDMAGVDTSAGVSVMGGAIFGQAGLAMSDDDGDGIYTVTTDLAMNSTVMFKYRNTTASTWDNQESVPADCGHGEWSDRQVVIAEDDITLDVVAFSSCTAGSPEPEPEPEPEPVANDNDQIAGEWKLAPEAGALGVGPGLGDIGWWSNSAADVDGRACLFDDTYTFGADDSFSNNMGDATWLEGWQGAAEGCGAPIAPHDGSNPATYVYDATAGTLTVTGDGAHIGLAKVHNTGEDGNSGGSITYTVTELTDTTMTLDINFGPGYWRFKLVSAEYVAPADVSVTFQVDMSAVETNADGVYVAGGAFGQDGLLMTDNGSDVWSVTVDVAPNATYQYKFRNQPSYGTWDGFEDAAGLVEGGCNTGQYDDRFVVVADADVTLPVVAYGSCTADAPVQAVNYNVTFSVDMNGVDLGGQTPTINGTFNGWCGDCNPLTDDDGDGVWTTTLPLPAGDIEYKFTLGAWVGQETVGADCVNAATNRSLSITDADVAAEVTPYGGCPGDNANDNDQIAGDWRLAPEAGALGVGPGLGDIGWWSNNDADVLTRLCLFDDVLSFNADGSFTHDMQDATWLEGWQGAAEGCGTPVAPHDGSNAATYEYDATAGTLTVTGDGAHIGLAKVHNTGEDGNSGGSVTYEVTELTDTTMTLDINFGPGYWRFKLVTADSVPVPVLPTTVAVTFQVDMAGVDTSAGVSVMGGAIFGQAGLAMSDDDGDGIYTVTTDLAMNSTVMFKYRNTTASTWDNQESVPADCGHGEWSDRQVVIAEDDITLDVVAFSSCTAGSPEPEPEPEPEPVANDNDQIAGGGSLLLKRVP